MLNKKYNWSQFTQRVSIAAPIEKVYQMWTEPEQLCKWFLSGAKMNLKKGGSYEWTWIAGFKVSGKILNVERPRKITFSFAESICEVTIKKNKRGSLVNLHQYNIPVTEEHKSGIHLSCNCGWTFYLINLKTYLEYGIDLRETNPKHLKESTIFY